MRQRLALFALLIFAFALVSCEGDGDSAKVELTIIPESPIVIEADLTIPVADDEDTTITGPYFRWMVSVTNKSSKKVVITAFKMTVTAPGIGESESTYDSAESGGFYFVALDPNESQAINVIFYASGLPEDPSGRYHYRVELEPIGWFLKNTTDPWYEASARLRTTKFFYTQ